MPTPDEIIAGDISAQGLKKSELLSNVKRILSTHGVCVIRGVLDHAVVCALRDAAQERMYELQRLLLLKSTLAQEGSVEVRFKEVVERDGGRCDVRFKMDQEPFCSFKQTPLLREIGESILGSDMIEQFYGVVTALGRKSLPYCDLRSSGAQQWHQDGGNLFDTSEVPRETLPIHCVNIFFPLVDVAENKGATEFLLGSHTCSNYETEVKPRLDKSEQTIVDEKAGSIILFDYRTWHRGGEHGGVDDRHVLYLTFSKPWFVDHKNHRSTSSIFVSTAPCDSSRKRKHLAENNSGVETFDGIDLWPARRATVDALEWKREGRSDQERYDKQFCYTTDDKKGKFNLQQSREGICSTVWDASIVLAKYFEAHPDLVRGKRCLGLGSGCGLTELVADYLGATCMCATDVKSALPLLEANLQLLPIEQLHVTELEWGLTQSLSCVKGLGPFDVIIGADIVYVEASGNALVETIDSLMGPTTRVCLAYGRNRQYLSHFLKAAKRRGIRFKQVPYKEHHQSYRAADIDIIWGQRNPLVGCKREGQKEGL